MVLAMTSDERLNLRARQILDDPSLSPNQRVSHPDALLKALVQSVREDRSRLDAIVDEITDDAVASAMRSAIEAQLA